MQAVNQRRHGVLKAVLRLLALFLFIGLTADPFLEASGDRTTLQFSNHEFHVSQLDGRCRSDRICPAGDPKNEASSEWGTELPGMARRGTVQVPGWNHWAAFG